MKLDNLGVFQQYNTLPVFKLAHSLTLQIYNNSKIFPKHELYGLTSQIRRSSSSIGANIVEGLFRNSKKELIQFLYTARASAAETAYHLLLAYDLHYIDNNKYGECKNKTEEIMKQLNTWIKAEKSKITDKM